MFLTFQAPEFIDTLFFQYKQIYIYGIEKKIEKNANVLISNLALETYVGKQQKNSKKTQTKTNISPVPAGAHYSEWY